MTLGRTHRESAIVDAVAGAASGLAASWVMEQAQGRIMRAGGEETRRREKEAQGDRPPATIGAAERAAGLVGRSVPEERKRTAGEAVHYATGALFGALFGVLAPRISTPALLAGVAYGAAVWLVLDETIVPALGLSSPSWRYPASTHAKALASHLVYGAATGAGFGVLHAAVH